MLKIPTLEIYIPGEPCAQGRPRFAVVRGHAVAFDPAKSKEYKNFVKMLAMQAMKAQKWEYTEKPLDFRISIFQSVPKSKSKKFKELAYENKILPTVKPDVDNVAKSIMDALSGIVYQDDKQITTLVVRKRYSKGEPYVVVSIIEEHVEVL